jgi:hypothetical protein
VHPVQPPFERFAWMLKILRAAVGRACSLACADCSALWRLARELRSAGALDAEAAPPGVTPFRRRAGPSRWLVGAGTLAAAAAAVVLLPRTVHQESSPVVRGAGTARSSRIQPR